MPRARPALVLAAALVGLVAPPAAAAPPPNDDFADATVIPSLPFTTTADLVDADYEQAPGCPAGTPTSSPTDPGSGGDVWYRYTPAADGVIDARLSDTTSFDVAVMSGSCETLTVLRSDSSNINIPAQVVVPVTGGTTYHVRVAYVSYGRTTLVVRHHTPPYPVVARQGRFLVRDSFSTGAATRELRYGVGGGHPLFGDWDGDGRTAVGVVRGNTWFLSRGTSSLRFRYGIAGDLPITGDWDGDGVDTPGVFRGNTWYLRNSNTAGVADESFRFGSATDVPVAGHWEGGTVRPGIGVFRRGTWYLQNLEGITFSFRFGRAGDRPVIGDWDGDGADSPGVVRGNTWYLRNSLTTGGADLTFTYGTACDRILTLAQAAPRAAPCPRRPAVDPAR